MGAVSESIAPGGLSAEVPRSKPLWAQILRRLDGLSYIEPPCRRHTDGDLVPAVVLPEELEDVIARAVLERAGAAMVVNSAGRLALKPT